jgi:hypothetical protein
MRRLSAVLLVLLAGCATTPGASAPTATLPSGARADLARKWVEDGSFRWPPRDGFDGQVAYLVLPAGVLLDRFGSDHGRFFSPKGAGFGARALPTVCAELAYSVYRVTAPLPVRIGSAAPWFDEPGGAMQVQTDATAAELVADGVLRRVAAGAAPCGG